VCSSLRTDEPRRRDWLKWTAVAGLSGAAVMFAVMKLYGKGAFTPVAVWLSDTYDGDAVQAALVYGIPSLFVLGVGLLARRRVPAAAAAGFGFALVALFLDISSNNLHQSRSFFGVLSVRSYDDHKNHSLVHGGILHGEQWQETPEDRAEPRSYYHREGPLGQIMAALDEHVTYPRIAAIGLGAGTVAAYGHKDNAITFYELNPEVEKLARDPKLFTVCRRLPAAVVRAERGDRRRQAQAGRGHGLLRPDRGGRLQLGCDSYPPGDP
jgi:hypothetical protein